jgi:hypothetical protein
MNKNFWKQFAIALALFLAGYFTFNSSFFAGDKAKETGTAPPLVQP